MIKRRVKSVTFRLSAEEYERLLAVSGSRGARSVSDFVRSCVAWIMSNCDRRIWDLVAPRGQNAQPDVIDLAGSTEVIEEDLLATEPLKPPQGPAEEAVVALQQLNRKIERLYQLIQNPPARDSQERADCVRSRQ